MEKQQSVTKEVEIWSQERERQRERKKKYIITKVKYLGTISLHLNLPKKPNAFRLEGFCQPASPWLFMCAHSVTSVVSDSLRPHGP